MSLLLCAALCSLSASWSALPAGRAGRAQSRSAVSMLAKTKRKQLKRGPPNKIDAKGFGARPAMGGRLLEEAQYGALYAWLGTSPLTNLRKVAVADFDGLRGVMAMQDIGKGEEIVAIPATFAVDLGADGADAINAAQRLLATRAAELAPAYEPDEDELDQTEDVMPSSPRAAYWATLPPPDSADLCTPAFFKEEELAMLQWPPLVAETRQRAKQIRNAIGGDEGDEGGGQGGVAESGAESEAELSETRWLEWATWAVLSRVLTVQGPPNGGGLGGGAPVGRKLLIPFIDMFNHRAGTKHYLTGRTDGMLKVVAGAPVRAGEQIFILYGVDSTSNQEFVSHYGFHDPSATAATADRALVRARRDELGELSSTSEAEDEAALAATPPPPYHHQLALRLRLSLKRAAAAEGLLPIGDP